VVAVYRAARRFRLAAGIAVLGAVGLTACAREAPPRIPVSEIFDASPNCGGADGGTEAPPVADAAAPEDAPAVDPAGPPAPPPKFARDCQPGRLRPGTLGRPGTPKAKVLLISVDGLRPDAIFHAPAPNLQALACQGAYSWRARTIHPSITLPSHASMVSGFPPERHGIYHNDLQPGYIKVPTVLSAAHQAGRKVVLVVGKEKMIQLVPPGSYDVFVWTPDLDGDVIDKAVEEVAAGFDLMFVHLPMVDLTGHAQGWMSDPYLTQVRATDAALGKLLAVVPPETTIFVTADHGGSGYIHWSGAPEDVHIPWIVKGPGIRSARALGSEIHTFDTAATIGHVLGVPMAPDVQGKPVLEPWN
jgi:hypothetical protein